MEIQVFIALPLTILIYMMEFSFIILVIGLFSVSEIFFILENTRTSQNIINKTGKIFS